MGVRNANERTMVRARRKGENAAETTRKSPASGLKNGRNGVSGAIAGESDPRRTFAK